MCLIINKGAEIRCADREVECWKVLKRGLDGVLRSPYAFSEYEVGKEKVLVGDERILIEDDKVLMHGVVNLRRNVVNHGLHTYAEFKGALKYKEFLSDFDYVVPVIVRCVIPVGAMYIEGRVNCEFEDIGYVSDRLVVKEEVR